MITLVFKLSTFYIYFIMKNFSNLSWVWSLVLLLILSSCKKNEVLTAANPKSDVILDKGRLSFKDTKTLLNTVIELNKENQEAWNSWEEKLGFMSFRRSNELNEELESFGFPSAYASLININGEYLVGDTIVWFHEGYKYMVPNRDEELLVKIKADPSISKIKYKAGLVNLTQKDIKNQDDMAKVSNIQNNNTISSVWLGSGGVDARYQRDYYGDDGTSLRKWVYEIYNYVEGYPSGYNCYLFTKIKHYYKGSGKWKIAGETTEKSITNLNVSVYWRHVAYGTWYTTTQTNLNYYATDNGFLERIIWSGITSSPSIQATVTGNYHAKVTSPGWFSQSLWDVAASW